MFGRTHPLLAEFDGVKHRGLLSGVLRTIEKLLARFDTEPLQVGFAEHREHSALKHFLTVSTLNEAESTMIVSTRWREFPFEMYFPRSRKVLLPYSMTFSLPTCPEFSAQLVKGLWGWKWQTASRDAELEDKLNKLKLSEPRDRHSHGRVEFALGSISSIVSEPEASETIWMVQSGFEGFWNRPRVDWYLRECPRLGRFLTSLNDDFQ